MRGPLVQVNIGDDEERVLLQPSAAQLLDLVNDMREDGDFLVVQRDEEAEGYLQTAYPGEGEPFVIELSDGSTGEQSQLMAPDKNVVHQVLFGYAYDRPGWRDLASSQDL